PDRVVLELEMRTPRAVVETGDWRLLVDAAGCVLDDRASEVPPDLPVIRGDHRSVPRIPQVGMNFRQPAVLHGLSVIRDLARHTGHPVLHDLRIAIVDVTNVGGRRGSEILLELAGGPPVEWGSAAESE